MSEVITALRPDPVPEDTLIQWLDTLSNWGRWGDHDEAGTLNLISQEHRTRAAGTVTEGLSVSCGLTIGTDSQAGDLYGAPHRFMVRTGQGLNDEHRVVAATAIASSGGRPRLHPTSEYIALSFHGPNITHLDALCHQSWDAHMYNGIPAELVTAERGATALSVLAARGGIVTRGVLIDVARDRGVPSLPPGEGVGPEELEAFEHRHGLRILPGDAVLLRTGYGAQRRISGPSRLDQGWAGWHPSTLPWLHERDVALVGSDTFNEALPNGYKDVTLPLHTVGIIGMGLWLLDNCDLEAAGATAEQLGRSEFLFCLAPLAIEGGTGSPANPLAVF